MGGKVQKLAYAVVHGAQEEPVRHEGAHGGQHGESGQ
jgi:hypothetical protein